MRRVVVVINGYPRSGKDTVCNFVIERLHEQGWMGGSISSVDPVRNMLRDLGVPVDRKTPAERALMAEIKSSLERYDWWATRLCAQQVRAWFHDNIGKNGVCFAHMRETAAIRMFCTLFDSNYRVRTLLVTSPRAERVTSNIADTDVENMTYDLTINNNGSLEELHQKCIRLADKLMKEIIGG